MNAHSYFTTDSATVVEPIAELCRVSILKDFPTPSGRLPAGTRGTVVSVYNDGTAYCVEFTKPFSALLDIFRDDLISIEDCRDNPSANEISDRNEEDTRIPPGREP